MKNYNKELIERGSITFHFPKSLKHTWLEQTSGPGFQKIYSDSAIEAILMVRSFFKLSLRATKVLPEAFLSS